MTLPTRLHMFRRNTSTTVTAMRRALAVLVIATGVIIAGCNDPDAHLKDGFERPIGVGDEWGLRMILENHYVPTDKMGCMVDKLMANYVTQTQMGGVRFWWERETLNEVAAECGVKVTKRRYDD